MKLLIIGHSVEDHLHREGKDFIQPGGIYYTASAVNAVKNKEDEIYLCTSIEKNNCNLFADVYDQLNQSLFQEVQSIPKVHLTIHSHKERDEDYENLVETLLLPEIDFNMFDGILINMITGFDISLEQLKKLRAKYTGIIYFDVHTLSRGVGKRLHREFRIIPQFNEWAENLDFIQANNFEIFSLGNYKSEFEAAADLLKKENQSLIVTKDEAGARLYSNQKGELISIFNNAVKVKINNRIGCGDIFGAVFFYTYIKNRNLYQSIAEANRAAAAAVSFNDVNDLKNLSEQMELLDK